MVKIDLVTGFLGSGKTTFLKKYAAYLMSKGEKIGILENDYGAVNVDMLLLQELRGDNCEVEMISGGCDADCHKRRFKTKLISMAMCGYDRVIVEPSGIYDVDEFFDTLREEPLDRWYEIANVIAIVDSRLSGNISVESDFLIASQIANAGSIILSKTQLATQDEIAETKKHLKSALERIKYSYSLDDITISKALDNFTAENFDKISTCGYKLTNYVKFSNVDDCGYRTLYFLSVNLSVGDIENKIIDLFNDKCYGNILRVKGFTQNADKSWVEINATKNEISFQSIPVGQDVLIVIGTDLNEDGIRSAILS